MLINVPDPSTLNNEHSRSVHNTFSPSQKSFILQNLPHQPHHPSVVHISIFFRNFSLQNQTPSLPNHLHSSRITSVAPLLAIVAIGVAPCHCSHRRWSSCVWRQRLQPWLHLHRATFATSPCSFPLPMFFTFHLFNLVHENHFLSFPPFLYCLNLDLNDIFFSNFMNFGIHCGCCLIK